MKENIIYDIKNFKINENLNDSFPRIELIFNENTKFSQISEDSSFPTDFMLKYFIK